MYSFFIFCNKSEGLPGLSTADNKGDEITKVSPIHTHSAIDNYCPLGEITDFSSS